MAGAAGGRWASNHSTIHDARTGTPDARERCTEKRNVSCEISILLSHVQSLLYCVVSWKLQLMLHILDLAARSPVMEYHALQLDFPEG